MSEAMNKRPGEVLDYIFDFSRWLSGGDKIANATANVVSAVPAGVEASAAIWRVLFDDLTATAWVRNGVDGETAEVTVQIVTAMGRVKDARLRLRITE